MTNYDIMYSSMKNVIVLGGFTESRRVLEPVADQAVELHFGADAEVLTLRDALYMDSERLRRLMAGQSVIAHSAAVLAVPDAGHALHASELPQDMSIVAAPEPKPIARLARAATRKTMGHVFTGGSHFSAAHRRVAAGNTADVIAHPLFNAGLVPEISRFSTRGSLIRGDIAASRRVGYYMMSDDEFYGDPHWRHANPLQVLQRRGDLVAELAGGHDELLTDPDFTLRGIAKVQFENMRTES